MSNPPITICLANAMELSVEMPVWRPQGGDLVQ